nr:helix-turn-helix domain-containing protein [Nitrospirota bacterium]
MAIVRSSQRIAAKKRMRAQVLLKVDEGEHGPAWTDPEAAEAFNVDVTTVHHIRKQLVLSGWDGALERKERADPPRKRIFDAKGEEEVPAVATGEPPQGRARWTLRLLADEIVRLDIADSVSHETVRTILKKKISSLTVRPDG